MPRKSDRPTTRRISATVAGRSFSRVLDEIEKGRSFVIFRHGKDVCAMNPVSPGARALSDCVAILKSRAAVHLDGEFEKALMEVIAGEVPEKRPWD
jgi:antitoxin (DNA-binding transcriptional repressor) of toxin-antitoxin stability system